eukprot:5652865-Pleurochrysis_carterae.AAC.3
MDADVQMDMGCEVILADPVLGVLSYGFENRFLGGHMRLMYESASTCLAASSSMPVTRFEHYSSTMKL